MEIKKCVVCGKLSEALYICQACRRAVCGDCFEPVAGVCIECHKHPKIEATAWTLPVKLFFLSFVLMLTGLILMIAASLSGVSTLSGGVVVIVWPIPIILGAGPNAFLAVLLASVLAILWLVFLILTLWKKAGKD